MASTDQRLQRLVSAAGTSAVMLLKVDGGVCAMIEDRRNGTPQECVGFGSTAALALEALEQRWTRVSSIATNPGGEDLG